jgi:hypothetical protein
VPAPDRPVALLVAVAALALQIAGMAVYSVAVLVKAVSGDASSAQGAALLIALTLVWAGGLVLAARGLWQRRRWARSPAVVSELLLVAIGVPLVQGGVGWVGVPLVVGSAVAVVALLTPAVTAALTS